MTIPRILITGAAGFVGAHAANAASDLGWYVLPTDIQQADHHPVLRDHLAASLVTVDVTDDVELDRMLRDHNIDGIMHCAGVVGPARATIDMDATISVNVSGTLRIARAAAAQGARLTYLSTATLYGKQSSVYGLREDADVSPVGLYDASKYMGEIGLNLLARTDGLHHWVLRPSFVYGQGSTVGQYFVPSAIQRIAVRADAGADHPCEFTYVKDLVSAMILTQTVDVEPGTIFNVSSGEVRTLGELATVVRATVPEAIIELGPGIDPRRHLRGRMSLAQAQEKLGYQPRYTIELGVRDWVEAERAAKHRLVSGAENHVPG